MLYGKCNMVNIKWFMLCDVCNIVYVKQV